MSHQFITNERQKVLGYPVDLVGQDNAMSIIDTAWSSNSGMHVITLNAEMIIAAQSNSRLDQIIRQANLVVADGAGVVLALKLYGCQIGRLPGIELAQLALADATAKNIPIALIGGTPDVLNVLRQTLPQTYPGINLVVCQDGYFQESQEQTIIKTIKDSGVQLILVAMGIPRQEYFIELCRQTISQAVFIGVGGSFDIWSGTKSRAPAIFRSFHLEWLYRLLSEPWRFKRMSQSLPKFAYQIIVDFFKKNEHD